MSFLQTFGEPSNLTPLQKASGLISPPLRETSGSVGSFRPSMKPQGSAASRSVSIRCREACAGRVVGPDARTVEVHADEDIDAIVSKAETSHWGTPNQAL